MEQDRQTSVSGRGRGPAGTSERRPFQDRTGVQQPADRSGGPPGPSSRKPDPRQGVDGRRWGSVARKGSRVVGEDLAGRRAERQAPEVDSFRQWPVEEVWVLDDDAEGGAVDDGWGVTDRRDRSSDRERRRRPGEELPVEVVQELVGAVGTMQGERLARQLASAVRSYERDRYEEAFRITRGLVSQAPESMAVVELHGLVCYRLGKWQQAAKFLAQAVTVDNGVQGAQIPVLMDCHRALNHHRRVQELWDELRSMSPDSDVLVEGRLVLAADLADRDLLGEAIELLVRAGAGRTLRRPADRHLRQWYLLGDLYERAGDLPRARALFQLIVEHDPEVADVAARLAALGGAPGAKLGSSGSRGSVTLGELARVQRPKSPKDPKASRGR